MSAAIPTKPYLVRAIYEWCVDCGFTPYISVVVDEFTRVPSEYVKNGEIILNLSSSATRNLKIDNDGIHFSARFNGVSREVAVPVTAVSGIFARENGEGLLFKAGADGKSEKPEEQTATPLLPRPEGPPTTPGGRSHLKLIK
jgi:stringent starvation protein B